MSSERQEGK